MEMECNPLLLEFKWKWMLAVSQLQKLESKGLGDLCKMWNQPWAWQSLRLQTKDGVEERTDAAGRRDDEGQCRKPRWRRKSAGQESSGLRDVHVLICQRGSRRPTSWSAPDISYTRHRPIDHLQGTAPPCDLDLDLQMWCMRSRWHLLLSRSSFLVERLRQASWGFDVMTGAIWHGMTGRMLRRTQYCNHSSLSDSLSLH